MKAEDRLKKLIESGEINSLDAAKQEGFIKGWSEALRIHVVVGRSEQLKAFAEMVANDDMAYLKDADTLLKEFESL